MRKIHFEDHGQDFLWFTVDDAGRVQDCGPYQGWLWAGRTGQVVQGEDGKQYFRFDEGLLYSNERTINYPVEKVEIIQ